MGALLLAQELKSILLFGVIKSDIYNAQSWCPHHALIRSFKKTAKAFHLSKGVQSKYFSKLRLFLLYSPSVRKQGSP